MKTIFEAASMLVLFAFSQLAFGTNPPAKSSTDNGVSYTSTANPTTNGHGQMVKPLSL